jgi:general secretion pathway protein L
MSSSTDYLSGRARAPFRQRLAVFWRWWTEELRQLMPAGLSKLGGAHSGVPLVMLRDGEVVTIDAKGQPSNTPRDARGRVRLVLAREEALMRRVTLPAATEENLAQVIGFEMDRLTPFRAEDVYFDHRVVARDPTTGQIQVQVALARRDAVDPKVERLRALGANVQGVTIQDDATAPNPLDLLPHEMKGQRDMRRDLLIPGLAFAVLALLVVALLLPVYQKRATVIELHPVLAKAKQEAEATDVIRTALEKQVTDYNFLVTRKQGTWPTLAFIEEVSRLLPDNTWVSQMDVKTAGKNREVQVTGETASASKLIEIFEQSTVLQNATPKGAVVRGSIPGTERFMIVAEARPRVTPPPRPLIEVAESLPNIPVAPPPPITPPAAAPPVAELEVERAAPKAPQQPSRGAPAKGR